jgi:hypothetical protein
MLILELPELFANAVALLLLLNPMPLFVTALPPPPPPPPPRELRLAAVPPATATEDEEEEEDEEDDSGILSCNDGNVGMSSGVFGSGDSEK